ncbi:MAG: D-alanyl-D-alanine carboxypeptidase family protein [Pseudomonadota bacterium]
MKLRDVRGFLLAVAIAVAALLLVTLRVTGCASTTAPQLAAAGAGAGARPLPGVPEGAAMPVSTDCRANGWSAAAQTNANSLKTLAWSPFGRAETGWEIYVPLIQQELGAACPPNSEGFAAAYARWQARQGQPADGVFTEAGFLSMKGTVQTRRDFVRFTSTGACPETSDVIAAARPDEGYSGKQVWLRPGALNAYRRMVAAARAEVPEIAADPRNLTIFSGYRSPSSDAARCAAEGNCDGVVRARCSAHRTGLAADMYVGQAPGYGPDSSADPNRLFMTQTPTYRWLLANAPRFGFVNYPFEPWHWEWTGEAP